MRAIKINPVERTITEINLKRPNQSLDELYKHIGCDIVELVKIDKDIVLCCDEEGKLKVVEGAFRFWGTDLTFVGNAVILGFKRGEFTKLLETKASFEMMVEWLDV